MTLTINYLPTDLNTGRVIAGRCTWGAGLHRSRCREDSISAGVTQSTQLRSQLPCVNFLTSCWFTRYTIISCHTSKRPAGCKCNV